MNLFINTTKYNLATFALVENRKVVKKTYKFKTHESYQIINKLDEFLKKNKINTTSPAFKTSSSNLGSGIRKIYVNKGPGSFMGTRIGIAIGMALGLAWKVPVKYILDNKYKSI